MIKQTIVTCCNDCPLLNTSGYTMYCKHPALKSEADAHIVHREHRDNSTTPEQCPLRTSALLTIIKLRQA